MDIAEIKNNINAWNEVRNTDIGLTFLTSGYAIELSREEFVKWNKRLENEKDIYIHLYIGISQFKIIFYLVDSETDQNETYLVNENLFVKYFTRNATELSHDVDIQDIVVHQSLAINRIFKWFFSSSQWFYKQTDKPNLTDTEGVVRVFTIPYEDFQKCFETTEQKALILFGLRDYTADDILLENEIEVLVCSESNGLVVHKKNDNLNFEDLTTPHPPFSINGEGFNLL